MHLPTQLLHGPYQAPRLQIGARTYCLLRDCLVTITSWTDAPIPSKARSSAVQRAKP